MINNLLKKEGLNIEPLKFYDLNELIGMTNEKFNQSKTIDEFLNEETTQELIDYAINKNEIPIINLGNKVFASEKITLEFLMFIQPKFKIEVYKTYFNTCGGADKFFEKMGFEVVKVDNEEGEKE